MSLPKMSMCYSLEPVNMSPLMARGIKVTNGTMIVTQLTLTIVMILDYSGELKVITRVEK